MPRSAAVIACLLALGSPARADSADVFPADFCSTLPALSAEDQGRLAQRLPEYAGAPARLVPAETALQLLDRAAAQGLSALHLFTLDAVREDCAFVIPGETVSRLGERYEMFLISPFSGTGTDGRSFRTALFVFGRGRLFQFYDRGDVRYRHPVFEETFRYSAVIRERSPQVGVLELEGVHGPLGLPIQSLRVVAPDRVAVQAGPITVTRPLLRIERLPAASGATRPESAGLRPRPAMLRSLERLRAWLIAP